MNITVKLSLLDNKPCGYKNPVDIYLGGTTLTKIGACNVKKNENGEHLGDIQFSNTVSEELYFYYYHRLNNEGVFWFTGLLLLNEEQDGQSTLQLKDIITFYPV